MNASLANSFAWLAAIAIVWTGSLFLPAIEAGGRVFDGLEVLLRGWEGMPRGVLAWLANPLFVAALAVAAAKRNVIALVLSAASFVLGASSLMTEDMLRYRGTSVPPIEMRAGFYVWLAAMLALCLHSLTNVLRARRGRRADGGGRRATDPGTSRD